MAVLRTVLNIKLEREEQMADHIVNSETELSRLAGVKDFLLESTLVALFVFSLLNLPECAEIATSINRMKQNKASCE